VRRVDVALGLGQPRLDPIELLDHLAETVAERIGAQLHELAPQIAQRGVECLGRGIGDQQVRDVLEHLADSPGQRARGEPAAAVELDRGPRRRAGRHRVDHDVAAMSSVPTRRHRWAWLSSPGRSGCAARCPSCPGDGLDGVVGERPAGGQGRAALEVGLDVAAGQRDAERARQRRVADGQGPARWSAAAG